MSVPSSEQWRPIPGLEGRYDVSDHGRVRSWCRRKRDPLIMAPQVDAEGYPRVKVGPVGVFINTPIHMLLALAFIGPRPEGQQVRHLDGDPSNCTLGNLSYGTVSENLLDSVRHRTHHNVIKTHCPYGHPYDADNTYIQTKGSRGCKTCRRDYYREYTKRRRASA